MHNDEKWYDGIPEGRLKLYDKIYLLALINYKQGRYRYFDDFYTGLKSRFKIHPSELENQLCRYKELWNDVKLNSKTRLKPSEGNYDYTSTEALLLQGKIDARSYYLLKHVKIFTQKQILDYYSIHGTFLGLERCGEKTTKNLEMLCEDWLCCYVN